MVGIDWSTCLRALDACNGDSNRAAEALLLDPQRFGVTARVTAAAEASRLQAMNGAEAAEAEALWAATEASMTEAQRHQEQVRPAKCTAVEAVIETWQGLHTGRHVALA